MKTLAPATRQRTLELALLRVLDAVRALSPKVLKSGDLSLAQLSRIESQVELHEDAASLGTESASLIEFVLALGRRLDLLAVKEGRLVWANEKCEAFFAQDQNERRERMRYAWLSTPHFNEFMRISHLVTGQTRANSRRAGGADCVPGASELRRTRKLVLGLVASMASETWTTLKALTKRAEQEQPDLMLAANTHPLAHTPDYIGIRLEGESADLARAGNWAKVEGALLEEVLIGPCFWLGYLDAEVSAKSTRLKALAGPLDEEPLGDERPLMIQANYDVMALLPEMRVRQIWRVLRLATMTQFAQAAHLKLQEQWVIQAINAGDHIDQILEELKALSRTPVPQNVVFSLEEWGRRAERITIWLDACFIEAEGIEDACERLRPLHLEGFDCVDAKHAVVPESMYKDARAALPARAVELDYARQLPPVLHAHANGDLSLDHEGAHFRARQAVSAYAEAVGLDRYRITPESLAKLRVSGQGVEDLVARLRQLCINELAPLFEAKLRAWLGAAGRVEVSQPLLAKFDDAVIAGLLARSPEVEEFFGQALSLSAFALEPSQEAALTEFLRGLSCELAESKDLGALQRTQGFAHVIERPTNAREGFSAVAFQDAKRKSLGAALSYATPFGATLVVKATSAGVKEATAMLAKRLWWDGRDGVFEADGKYGHQHFVLPLAAIELLEVAP